MQFCFVFVSCSICLDLFGSGVCLLAGLFVCLGGWFGLVWCWFGFGLGWFGLVVCLFVCLFDCLIVCLF